MRGSGEGMKACAIVVQEELSAQDVREARDREKRIKAYRQQSSRRNLSKKAIAKRFLRNDYDGESQQEIADLLGVSKRTVRRAKKGLDENELNGNGECGQVSEFPTREDRRIAVWDEVEDNPDSSNRSIARTVGVDKNTVKSVRKKCEPLFDALDNSDAPIERAIAVIQLKQYLGWENPDEWSGTIIHPFQDENDSAFERRINSGKDIVEETITSHARGRVPTNLSAVISTLMRVRCFPMLGLMIVKVRRCTSAKIVLLMMFQIVLLKKQDNR